MSKARYIEIEDLLSRAAEENNLEQVNALLGEKGTVEKGHLIKLDGALASAVRGNTSPELIRTLVIHSSNTDLNQSLARLFEQPEYNATVKMILGDIDIAQLSEATIGQAYNNLEIVKTLHEECGLRSFDKLHDVAISDVFNRGAHPEWYQGQEDPESAQVLSYLETNGLHTDEVTTLGEV
jgi:hypothetical protein